MTTPGAADDYVRVVCPTCNARLHPRRALLGKRVRCPDCGVAVRVVESPVEHASADKPQAVTNHGEYALSEDDQPVVQPNIVLAVCGLCGARLHPRVELIGKRVRCPDCGRPVLVSPPAPAPKKKKEPPPGEYRLGSAPEPNPMPYVMPISTPAVGAESHAAADIRSAKVTSRDAPDEEQSLDPATAPRWWFASGVFGFPWYPGTVSRWGTLTVFALFSNAVTAYGLSLMSELEGAGGLGAFGTAMKVAGLLAVAAIVWLLMLAYAAGCITVVIRESAAGVDDISDWSEAEIHEGIWRILNLAFPLMASAGLGYGVRYAIAQCLTQYIPQAGTMAFAAGAIVGGLTFPLMLVSTLECGAFWMLLSPTALRLVLGCFPSWVLVNLIAAAITGGWWWLTATGAQYAAWPTIILGAPLMSAVILIDARLIGRFLYRAAEVAADRSATEEEDEIVGDE